MEKKNLFVEIRKATEQNADKSLTDIYKARKKAIIDYYEADVVGKNIYEASCLLGRWWVLVAQTAGKSYYFERAGFGSLTLVCENNIVTKIR